MIITICGGGSLGHVCLGVLSSQKSLEVNILTSKPEKWQQEIIVTDINEKKIHGHIHCISKNPADVIPMADMIILCLPGFAIEEELLKIKPYLNPETIVGSIVSSTGFFFFAHKVLGDKARIFGFQRVPFISRTLEYGKSARLLGYKEKLKIAAENIIDKEELRLTIQNLFSTPTTLLNSSYEASLTNSNPILHTARLYSMWHDWDGTPYNRRILFYKECAVDAAQWLIDMDEEFMQLLEKLPMDKSAVPSLLDYYESHDAPSLAQKLCTIKAFESIYAPMKEIAPGAWVPDFSSRYFTEDFPYGLKWIHDLAHQNHVLCPHIDTVYAWGISKCE